MHQSSPIAGHGNPSFHEQVLKPSRYWITAISVFLDKVSGTLRKWQQNLCSLDTHTTIISITSSSHSVIHTSTPSSIITPSSSYWSIIWSRSLAQQSSWWIIKSFDFTPATSEDLNIPIWKWFKVQVSA